MANVKWKGPGGVLEHAARIVNESDTGVTLRQLFYRLVSQQLIDNTTGAYQTLSKTSAAARRKGDFPNLIDQTREIHRLGRFSGPKDALEVLTRSYTLDRTDDQECNVYLGVEKHGMIPLLTSWFSKYGVPIIALGGYASQTFVDDVNDDVNGDGRYAVLIYAGDLDPSGEHIPEDFKDRANCFDKYKRIAVTRDQVKEYQLPKSPFAKKDSRNDRFLAEHGELYQVELDALPPEDLRDIYQHMFFEFFDVSKFMAVIERERADRVRLEELQTMLD